MQIASMTTAQHLMYLNQAAGKEGVKKFNTRAEAQAFLEELNAKGK